MAGSLNHKIGRANFVLTRIIVPEIQGTTEQVATEKCRRAAELVRFRVPPYLNNLLSPPLPSPLPKCTMHGLAFHFTFPQNFLLTYPLDRSHTGRRPCDHGRHSVMFRGYERPTRPLHQIFLARTRSRGYVCLFYTPTPSPHILVPSGKLNTVLYLPLKPPRKKPRIKNINKKNAMFNLAIFWRAALACVWLGAAALSDRCCVVKTEWTRNGLTD